MKSTLFIVLAAVLLCGCDKFSKNTPEATVKKYLQAKQWDERLQFVRRPEQVRPLMAK
jgi:hypothetical protein